MRSVNKVILIGNLTRDPMMKTGQNGQPLATFGIATNRKWKNSTGQDQTSTEFHEVVVWARLAEFASKNLKKGKLVYVEGYLKTRSWEAEDGTRRFKTEIVAQDLIILSKREADGDDEYDYAGEPVADEVLGEEIPSDDMF